jgi:hypothetical protein
MLTQLFFRGQVLLVVTFLTAIGATALWGQAVNGTISGTVTDPSGAAIAGATVEVKNTATQVVRTVTATAQERFTVPELFVGNYDVRASAPGFQNSVQTSVPVVVGGERVVDMTMKIGQVQETVTVEAQAAQVNTSMKAMAPGFYGTDEDYSVGGARPEGQPDRHLVPTHKRGLLQPQEEEQSTLENLLSGAVVTAGRKFLLCLDKIRLPVDAHAGCYRASGRDVFGVA